MANQIPRLRLAVAGAFFFWSAAVVSGADRFTLKNLGGERIMVLENGSPFLVYNAGPQLKPGAPPDRQRCCYIYPVYTPNGVSPTDDFPRDHYHHRGIFWAWPVIETAQGTHDIWTIRGGHQRFKRWLEQESGESASLTVENGWWMGGREVATETVHISVRPTENQQREFSVTLTLTAIEPITIRGSLDNQKGYGGFSARFAPREGTLIRTDTGILSGDEDHGRHAWAELEASYAGKKALLRITSEPSNPGPPPEWCLRQYGFAGANFPGVAGFKLQPKEPLILKYRVTLRDLP